jgi:carbonic anhydrase
LENWLRLIRDVFRLHKEELSQIKDPEAQHCFLVELNVIEQVLNVYKTGIVQRKRIQTRQAALDSGKTPEEADRESYPRLHGMVFNPGDGVLKWLPVDYNRIGSLDYIYGLYPSAKH